MIPADFEIDARLTARALRTHVAPDARVETMGAAEPTQAAGHTPAGAKPALDHRTDVSVEKRVVARVGVRAVSRVSKTRGREKQTHTYE